MKTVIISDYQFTYQENQTRQQTVCHLFVREAECAQRATNNSRRCRLGLHPFRYLLSVPALKKNNINKLGVLTGNTETCVHLVLQYTNIGQLRTLSIKYKATAL